MSITRGPKAKQTNNPDTITDEWTGLVNALAEQISTWASEEAWSVEKDQKQVDEGPFGVYKVPVLTLEVPDRRRFNSRWFRLPGGRLILEPIARNFPGNGIVELYAYPTLYRVRLILRSEAASWEVLTDSGIPLHQEWNKENFVTLANDLLAAGQ
jgi:hypothetical protein